MPLHSILPHTLINGLPINPKQAERWCAYLETGMILYFPQTPLAIPRMDIEFLLTRHQITGRLHGNIVYKPAHDRLRGVDHKQATPEDIERLRVIMRRYSAGVVKFLSGFLAPYQRRWLPDYASYSPIDEANRVLPQRHRNNLLHIDAFPTRPTRGWRILRFFSNIHPSKSRDWVVGEPFPRILGAFWPTILATPRSDGGAVCAARRFAEITRVADLVPSLKRTPYDRFMLKLHNAMKQDAEFQRLCAKESLQFAPGSSWMVYTETIPHAVQAGQYALEQTLLVDPAATVTPDSAPLAILEQLTGAKLA